MISFLVCVLYFVTATCCGAGEFTFQQDPLGSPPSGFKCALSGQGAPGAWIVMAEGAGSNVSRFLVQTNTDPVNYRFPLCLAESQPLLNPQLSVRFRSIAGQKDRAAGIVWRFQDTNNYYVVRANALENNVVLYKMQDGKRTDLKPVGAHAKAYGKEVPVLPGQWHLLSVKVNADVFSVGLNNEMLFTVKDPTFSKPGAVGLWTKADSLVQFDDFKIQSLE